MAAMLRSALAGLALGRSSARLRLSSYLSAVSFSDNTTFAGRTNRRRADPEESNKDSHGAKDKKARTKPKARQEKFSNLGKPPRSSTSSNLLGDLDDAYMTAHLLHDIDSWKHPTSRRQGPASSAVVPPDHRDEHESIDPRGSSAGPADSTTTDNSLPTTGSSSLSPPEDSSCSGGSWWWGSGNSWDSGESSYSGSDWDFSDD